MMSGQYKALTRIASARGMTSDQFNAQPGIATGKLLTALRSRKHAQIQHAMRDDMSAGARGTVLGGGAYAGGVPGQRLTRQL